MSMGRAERQGDTESEAGSRLWAVSTEPDAGLELMNCEIMTWAEVGCLTDWATQVTLLFTSLIILFTKKNEILPFATMWMELECIMLSKISQSEKGKYHMISLICAFSDTTDEHRGREWKIRLKPVREANHKRQIQRTNWGLLEGRWFWGMD